MNLDDDDSLAINFMERIQRLAKTGEANSLFLEQGLISAGDRGYLWRDRDNAFCTSPGALSLRPSGGSGTSSWADFYP